MVFHIPCMIIVDGTQISLNMILVINQAPVVYMGLGFRLQGLGVFSSVRQNPAKERVADAVGVQVPIAG